MYSLRFGSWKDFSLGWWNSLVSHGSQRPPFWKFDIVDPTSSWFTRSCMKSHEQTFAKVDQAVHDNICEVLIAGSLSYLYSWLPTALFYLHRGTSLIGSCRHVSRGGRPLACHFANTSVEMAKFVRSASKILFYWPWIQAVLFLIAIEAPSAAVRAVCWVDFANSTSADHFDFNRLYPTTVNKVWCLQCGQMFYQE